MKALVIGHGRMGRFHARVLRDLGYTVTTVDPDPSAAADTRGIPMAKSFDVACIATPIDRLAVTASAVVGMINPSFLLVEKPFASTVADAQQLDRLLSDRKVAVGYVERFNPQFRALRERVREGRLLSAQFTRYNARPCADVALDLQSHDVDLAHVLGLDPSDHAQVCLNSLAGAAQVRREIKANFAYREIHDQSARSWRPIVHRIDLTDHDVSPLHAQWHALLSGGSGYATPADAIAVLKVLERRRARGAAPTRIGA